MKRVLKTAVVVCLLGVTTAWLLSPTPVAPTAFIRVVDTAGNPVAGAVVQPDGLRPKNNGGHYLWTDRFAIKPLPVTTDTLGVARVSYPYFVVERLETGEISFRVEHPEFCSDRPFRVVSAAPPANASLRTKARFLASHLLALLTRKASVYPDPVVLQRGVTVEVSGYHGAERSKVSDLIPVTSANAWPDSGFWKRVEDGRFISKRIPPGTNHLRLVHVKEGSPVLFSEFVTFNAVAGDTNRFNLELKPGLKVTGRLSDVVPRPVTHGRVVAEVVSAEAEPSGNPPIWHVSAAVRPDGTFVLDSLPPGRMEMIGICDGFVSANGPTRRSTGQRVPQQFDLVKTAEVVVLAMESGAAVEVLVLDDAGLPLEGAEIAFWPNVLWNGYGSTLFADNRENTADVLRRSRRPDWSSWVGQQNQFSAKSDRRGIAQVRDLPEVPGTQSFMATHADFEMPVHRDAGGNASRYGEIPLRAAETNHATVKLQKKGRDFVTH